MGFLDALFLIPISLILFITIPMLIISLRSTNDEKEKIKYRRTYMPYITLCVSVLILYFGAISIINTFLIY